MTWNSDSAGVVVYSILAAVLVLSWIYIPAQVAVRIGVGAKPLANAISITHS